MEGNKVTAHSENTQNINVHSKELTFWNQPNLYAQCLSETNVIEDTDLEFLHCVLMDEL